MVSGMEKHAAQIKEALGNGNNGEQQWSSANEIQQLNGVLLYIYNNNISKTKRKNKNNEKNNGNNNNAKTMDMVREK
jgi:hypothetical protein